MKSVFLRLASKAKTTGVLAAASVALMAGACLGVSTPAFAETYSLTYKADGNDWTCPDSVPASLNAGDQVKVTFEFTNQNPGRYHGNRIVLNTTGDTTLTEGGSDASKVVDYSFGKAGTLTCSYTANEGTPLTIQTWNPEQHCGNHQGCQVASILVTVDESEGYTISYQTNGGTAVSDAKGTALPSELPTTTREGGRFEGWYTDAEFKTPAVAGAELTSDITLYAKWSHEHIWEYEGFDNGVFKAYCSSDVCASECDHNGEENALMLTVKDYQNPFSDEEKAAWEAAGLPLPTLSYRLEDGTPTTPENSGADSEGGVPTKPGKYSLWVVFDGEVATYDFEVPEAKKDDSDSKKDEKKNADGKLPQTGDSASLTAVVLGLGVAAAAAGMAIASKRQ